MSSHMSDVLDALLTVLRASHAHYDLSTSGGTARVDVADGGLPPIGPPFVLIAAPTVSIEYGQLLTQYSVSAELEWWGWAPTTDLSTLSRVKAALDLSDDVATAIQNAHHNSPSTVLASATRLLVQVDDVFGESTIDPPGSGLVHGRIQYTVDFLDRGI